MRGRLAAALLILELASALGAVGVLLPNFYHASLYRVDKTPWLPFVHFVAFAIPIVILLAGVLACLRRRGGETARRLSIAWLPLVANGLVVLRAGLKLEPFFLEPLVVSVSCALGLGLSVAYAAKASGERPDAPKSSWLPHGLMVLCALAAAAWLYHFQVVQMEKLAFGWTDAGLYYMRVKNTARGAGFLQETLARPPFYDHFNPGLALLVPFYFLCPKIDLILWAGALALGALGACVFVYARGRGLGPWESLLAGVAVLAHPSTSQLGYSFSYGFHPVTLALPAVVLSIHFWEKRRWALFGVCAIFASSMEETLFPLYAGLGIVELLVPSGRRKAGAFLTFLAVIGFLVAVNVVMPAVAGGRGYFQMVKFAHLGPGATEILLSPFTKPEIFWRMLFSKQSGVFVVLLLGCLGFTPLLAPRQFCYCGIVLVFVLLLDNPDVKSIAFWYQSLILVTWSCAAVAAVEKLGRTMGGSRAARMGLATFVLVSALATSHYYGLLPWSRMTTPFQAQKSAEFMGDAARIVRLARGTPQNARVLATMRAATLFVDAGFVAPLQDWQGGTDFDLVVLQNDDLWGQTQQRTRAAFEAFASTGNYNIRPVGRFAVMTRLPAATEAADP